MSKISSLDNLIASASTKKIFNRFLTCYNPNTVDAATANSGYSTVWRALLNGLAMPTFGSGVLGAWFPTIQMQSDSGTAVLLAAIETKLGTFNKTGNVFTAGSALPTKPIDGQSIQTASMIPMVVLNTANNNTGTLAITYTDQDGNTGASASIVIPSSTVIGSAFMLSPYLASGDTGVRAVTNITQSGGSATTGIYDVYGLLPLGFGISGDGNSECVPALNKASFPDFLVEQSDKINFYRIGPRTSQAMSIHVVGVAEY